MPFGYLAEEGDRNPGEGPFTDLKRRSTRMPPPCDHGIIDAFEKLVVDEIKRINPKHRSTNPNISNEEKAALQCLQSDVSLIIKPSDKGGNTVLMNRVEYVKMCMDILADETTYEVIRRDPSPEYRKSLNDILTRALEAHLISKNELNFLLPKSPVIATFYAIPKIHKGYPPLKGRPIVSGIDALGQNSSVYLDQVLRPFVVALPSYTRDTTDLLTKLDGVSVEAGTTLISIDVEALYSRIHHEAGLKAVQYFLNTRGNHLAPHNDFVMTLLEYVLCHNFFLFNGKFYHQLRGTAMGSPCAPTYANLLLGWWEDTVVFGDGDAVWGPHIQFWGRYIDDILVLWTGDIPTFHSFMESLNDNQLGLRFTYEVGGREISFLDVKLSIEENGSIKTTLFRKPTAANGLLRWENYHPTPLKRGIPKGQFLRLRRNCSENGDYHNKARDLKKRFTDHGYPRALLEEANQYAKTMDRTTLLHPRKKGNETPKTRLIGIFDDQQERVMGILRKHWGILRTDPDLNRWISPYPSVTYRKGPFKVVQIVNSAAVRLGIPSPWKMNSVLHVSLRKKDYMPDKMDMSPAPPIDEDSEEEPAMSPRPPDLTSLIDRRKRRLCVKNTNTGGEKNACKRSQTLRFLEVCVFVCGKKRMLFFALKRSAKKRKCETSFRLQALEGAFLALTDFGITTFVFIWVT
ncbi:unnamed protein product [Ranitomeya imitator]|uniref:Reverse transcriptase domain-containing protein n=1 Tax=Ranitomeya imitator TaxID=111125 RepID=A0ABN9MIY5_9NEOB|nr:unnamed protein product [Ranitomeya imitator]